VRSGSTATCARGLETSTPCFHSPGSAGAPPARAFPRPGASGPRSSTAMSSASCAGSMRSPAGPARPRSRSGCGRWPGPISTVSPTGAWPTTPRRRWTSAPPCAPATTRPARCARRRTPAWRCARAWGRDCPPRAPAVPCPNVAGRVLLQRRPPTGIWAALWSLPEHPDHAAARAWFERHVRGDFDAAAVLEPVAHAFTHYRLDLQPLAWQGVDLLPAVRDRADLRWVAAPELGTLGIPAPVRTLLAPRPGHAR